MTLEQMSHLQSADLSKPSDKVIGTSGNSPAKELPKRAIDNNPNSKYLNFVFGMAKWRREQLEDTRAIRQAVNRYGIYRLPEKKLEGLQ